MEEEIDESRIFQEANYAPHVNTCDWSEKKVKKECCAQISVKRKKEDNHKFPKTLYKLQNLSVFLFLSFPFLLILSYDNKQERAVMSDAAEILKSVKMGLNVVIFLLNTDRGLQATELCNECVILLQNLDSGGHLNISDVLFNAYYAISGYADAERHATKLLDTFHHAQNPHHPKSLVVPPFTEVSYFAIILLHSDIFLTRSVGVNNFLNMIK